MSTKPEDEMPPLGIDEALAEAGVALYPPAFQTAIRFILEHETEFTKGHYGDYNHVRTEDVPGDNGSTTRYGIDKTSHPRVDVAGLTLNDAIDIYWHEFQQHQCDKLPDKLAIAAFDVWVNGGHANEWLQAAFNANRGDQPELAEDGNLGPVSLAALAGCDQDAVLNDFCNYREQRFRRLAERPSLAQFKAGWLQRSTDLRALLS